MAKPAGGVGCPSVFRRQTVGRAEAGVGRGEIGVELDRALEQVARFQVAFPGEETFLPAASQPQIVGLGAAGQPVGQPFFLIGRQLDRQLANDLRPDFVLQIEDILLFPIIAFGPDVMSGNCVDQLNIDADPTAGLADAALKHETDTQFASDLADVR